MSRCAVPSSPIAVRAALMRLLRVDSETMRPCQTASSTSSRLTTRSRLRIRNSSRSKTWGSTSTLAPFPAQLAPIRIKRTIPKQIEHFPAPAPRQCAVRGKPNLSWPVSKIKAARSTNEDRHSRRGSRDAVVNQHHCRSIAPHGCRTELAAENLGKKHPKSRPSQAQIKARSQRRAFEAGILHQERSGSFPARGADGAFIRRSTAKWHS